MILYLVGDNSLQSILISGGDHFITNILGSNVGRLETTFSVPSLVWVTLLGVQPAVLLDVVKSLFHLAPTAALQTDVCYSC